MSVPPFLARVQYRALTFWIPLVLVWPLLLLALAPAVLLGGLATFFFQGLRLGAFLQVCAEFYRMLCALRGTFVSVDAPRARIAVTLY